MKIFRYLRFNYLKILRLKDTPYKVAKGVALGVSLDFLLLPFISILIAYVIAKLARFNSVAAATTAAVLKPAVFLVFWPMNILVGSFFLGGHTKINNVETMPEPNNIFKMGEYLEQLTKYIKHLGPDFLLGSVINSILSAIIVYFLVSRILVKRQRKRLNRKPQTVV